MSTEKQEAAKQARAWIAESPDDRKVGEACAKFGISTHYYYKNKPTSVAKKKRAKRTVTGAVPGLTAPRSETVVGTIDEPPRRSPQLLAGKSIIVVTDTGALVQALAALGRGVLH